MGILSNEVFLDDNNLKWFDIYQLPKNISPYIKFCIQNMQESYLEFGWTN